VYTAMRGYRQGGDVGSVLGVAVGEALVLAAVPANAATVIIRSSARTNGTRITHFAFLPNEFIRCESSRFPAAGSKQLSNLVYFRPRAFSFQVESLTPSQKAFNAKKLFGRF
jgi:hypothetical protein